MEKINKYFDTINIIYWINLNRSTDRKNNMIELLKKLPVKNERISAIDGKNISTEILMSNFIINDKNYTNIEYACLLSHLNAIKTFSETNYEYALILEDDMTLEFVKYWNKKISDIINQAPKDWEILLLTYTTNNKIYNTEKLYILTDNVLYGAGAYIINNKSAKKIINMIYNNNKFDLTSYPFHQADVFIFNLLKTYAYKYPYFIYPSNNDSNIHEEHLDFHLTSKKKLIYTWENGKETNIKTDNFTNNSNSNIKYILLFIIIIIVILILLILHLNYRI